MTMGQSSSPRSSPRLFVRPWHTRLSSQCRTTRPRLSTRLPITSQTTISVTATMTTICSHPTTTRTAPRITPTRTSPASAIIDSRGSLQTTSHIRSRTDTERSSRTSATTRVSSLSPLPSFHRTNPAARPPNSAHGRRHSGFLSVFHSHLIHSLKFTTLIHKASAPHRALSTEVAFRCFVSTSTILPEVRGSVSFWTVVLLGDVLVTSPPNRLCLSLLMPLCN